MDLRAAPDIFNMFESTDRERSSWAGLRDIAIYLPSLSPPILSLRERKKLLGWIHFFSTNTALILLFVFYDTYFFSHQIQVTHENAYLEKCGSWTVAEPLFSFPILKIPRKLYYLIVIKDVVTFAPSSDQLTFLLGKKSLATSIITYLRKWPGKVVGDFDVCAFDWLLHFL